MLEKMDWMRKHTAVVIWVIVAAFGVGVVWWSVGAYIGGQGATQNVNQAPSPSQAIALVTKGGTPLSYQYWIMPTDFNNYMQSVNSNYKNTYGQEPDPLFVEPQLELNAINTLVDQKIIDYFAKQSNITVSKSDVDNQVNSIVSQYKNNPQVLNYINQQYGSLQNFENYIRPQVEENLITQRVMSLVVNVTQNDVQNYYETNKATIENTYDQVKIAHISLSSEATAQKVVNLIKSGALTFNEAAKEYSLDTTTSASGGEVGWLTRHQVESALGSGIFSATPGSVIGPIQTNYSWEIVKVEAKKLYDNFDSVVQATSIYNTLVNDVKQQKFNEWLANYKNQNKFSYQLEGQVLPYFKEYYSIPATDTSKLEQFIQNMKSYIYPSNQATVNTSVDARLLALFVTALEQYKSDLNKQYAPVLSYHANKGSFPATYVGVPVDVLQKQLNEVQNSLNTATGTKFTKLFNEQTDLQTAINFNKAVQALNKEGYTTDEQINAQYDKYTNLISQINDQLKQVLTAIYQLVPYSTVAVSKLYSLDPSNQKVALSYFENQYNLLKPIISNPQTYQMYASQINPMFSYVVSGLQSLSYTAQSTSIKQGALITLISIAQDLNSPQQELTYLKQLKAINPNYQGIDQVIAQVESMITPKSTYTKAATVSTASPVATNLIPSPQATQFK
ncbi:MAG: peptidylprolyl isomerase [Athalassotoga sp.]|uniref:peptidylprolyl isomerase n=1 Tax=Athalassotoga sp. TaxID=2022597 RepID=UPI003D004652